MERSLTYNGTITAEQFLFYEIRIASKYYLQSLQEKDSFFVDLRDGKLVKDKTYKPVGEVVAL